MAEIPSFTKVVSTPALFSTDRFEISNVGFSDKLIECDDSNLFTLLWLYYYCAAEYPRSFSIYICMTGADVQRCQPLLTLILSPYFILIFHIVSMSAKKYANTVTCRSQASAGQILIEGGFIHSLTGLKWCNEDAEDRSFPFSDSKVTKTNEKLMTYVEPFEDNSLSLLTGIWRRRYEFGWNVQVR